MAKSTSKKSVKSAETKEKNKQRAEPRVLKKPKYQSFTLQKKLKPTNDNKIPRGMRLFWRSLGVLKKQWKAFLGIIFIYAVLNIVLVQGLASSTDVASAKGSLDQVFTGGAQHLLTGAALFTYILGASGSSVSPSSEGYQLIIVLVISLVSVWALRETYANHKIRIRDGFYWGMYPLIQFFLVLLVIGLQLIPFALGVFIFGQVHATGVAVTWLETALWAVITFILALGSLYMLSSSILALYIVCLQGMTPMRALRSARQLVRGRRWLVLRRIIFLPFIMLVVAAVIVIPFILIVTAAAPWVFFVLSMSAVVVIHSYMYTLYRELL